MPNGEKENKIPRSQALGKQGCDIGQNLAKKGGKELGDWPNEKGSKKWAFWGKKEIRITIKSESEKKGTPSLKGFPPKVRDRPRSEARKTIGGGEMGSIAVYVKNFQGKGNSMRDLESANAIRERKIRKTSAGQEKRKKMGQ